MVMLNSLKACCNAVNLNAHIYAYLKSTIGQVTLCAMAHSPPLQEPNIYLGHAAAL